MQQNSLGLSLLGYNTPTDLLYDSHQSIQVVELKTPKNSTLLLVKKQMKKVGDNENCVIL